MAECQIFGPAVSLNSVMKSSCLKKCISTIFGVSKSVCRSGTDFGYSFSANKTPRICLTVATDRFPPESRSRRTGQAHFLRTMIQPPPSNGRSISMFKMSALCFQLAFNSQFLLYSHGSHCLASPSLSVSPCTLLIMMLDRPR